MNIPHYLQIKLASLDITNLKEELIKEGYLNIFAKLRLAHPSLSYNALFDLYKIYTENNTPFTNDLKQNLILEFKNLPPVYPLLPEESIRYYLNEAEKQAHFALGNNEVPIGAVIVHENKIIGRGYNQTRTKQDIICHAEIQAIREAQIYLDNFRLDNCDIFVTLEPCLMCSGAIIHSRIRRLVFGALEPKTGASISQHQVFTNKKTNHHCQVIGPIDQAHFSELISNFFRKPSII